MSEMLELILDSSERIVKDHSTKELIEQVEQGAWPKDLWKALDESGLTTMAIPESTGGTGGDKSDAFHLLQIIAKYAAPVPIMETLIANWLLNDVNTRITSEVKTFYIHSGEKLKVEDNKNGYVVKGKISRVPWGRHAKSIVTLGEYLGNNYLIHLPNENASITSSGNLANEPIDTLVFDDVSVSKLEMFKVDEEEIEEKVMYLGGLAKSAMISGALEKVLELSIQYVQEREQFGRPIHRFQAIQQHLSVMAGHVAATKAITKHAIAAYGTEGFEQEVASAKLKANEACGIVAEIAHQIHGAIGATHEHTLHHFTRRLWAWREEYGNENKWAEELAFQYMHSGNGSIWEMISDKGTKINRGNKDGRLTIHG